MNRQHIIASACLVLLGQAAVQSHAMDIEYTGDGQNLHYSLPHTSGSALAPKENDEFSSSDNSVVVNIDPNNLAAIKPNTIMGGLDLDATDSFHTLSVSTIRLRFNN